jgi:hypothetical protein
MQYRRINNVPLPVGKTTPLVRQETAADGVWEATLTIDSDSVLLSLFVSSLASGNLDVVAYTFAEAGKEAEIITFPTIVAPTSELLLRKAAATLSNIRVVVTATGLATFDLRAKAISAGESSVKIVGAADLITDQLTVGNTPTSLIATSLTDRLGLVIRNWSSTDTLYIGETALKATTSAGYPIAPGESLGIDIQAGQSLFGTADPTSVDLRIMQAGES